MRSSGTSAMRCSGQSSKGRAGGGLGLFLALNVARALGGRISARNRPEGGAEVEISLPLAALEPPEEEEEDAADDTRG